MDWAGKCQSLVKVLLVKLTLTESLRAALFSHSH